MFLAIQTALAGSALTLVRAYDAVDEPLCSLHVTPRSENRLLLTSQLLKFYCGGSYCITEVLRYGDDQLRMAGIHGALPYKCLVMIDEALSCPWNR